MKPSPWKGEGRVGVESMKYHTPILAFPLKGGRKHECIRAGSIKSDQSGIKPGLTCSTIASNFTRFPLRYSVSYYYGTGTIVGKSKETLRGAEIFVRALIDEGVKHLFGYPGGAVLHIYDALYKQDVLEHILVRHEQGATHAADGYARATGKPGVVLVTSGPGATKAAFDATIGIHPTVAEEFVTMKTPTS